MSGKQKLSLNPCCNGIYSMRTMSVLPESASRSLNPCCNGIYSMRQAATPKKKRRGLNPCCNGIYSMSKSDVKFVDFSVLILVVMEYTQ